MMLSICASAAWEHERGRKGRRAQDSIWIVTASIVEIAAHFANLTQLLVFISGEGLELSRVYECVLVVHFIAVVWIWMKRCAERETLKYGFDWEGLEMSAQHLT